MFNVESLEFVSVNEVELKSIHIYFYKFPIYPLFYMFYFFFFFEKVSIEII